MILIFLSAVLMYLAFPNFLSLSGFNSLAWVAALPLFAVLEKEGPLRRVFYGSIFGIIFYGVLTRWFYVYNPWGYAFFVVTLALQPVFFAALFRPSFKTPFLNYTFLPAAWILSERMRVAILQGFSWDLAHSQSFDLPALQAVSLIGSEGLSFLIIFVNNCFYRSIRYKRERRGALLLAFVALFLIYSFGFLRLRLEKERKIPGQEKLKILALQPNIDPRVKIDSARVNEIVAKQSILTKQALLSYQPDLIIWPETAVPEHFFSDSQTYNEIKSIVAVSKSDFLLGAALEEEGRLYNSAVLLNYQKGPMQIYHKRFLVPFSEYMPQGEIWEMVKGALHIANYDFAKGNKAELFSVRWPSGGQARFGVLICSEDTIGKAFRQYRQAGADFVVVLLNDAWFENDLSLALHMQNTVIHAVANGFSVVRVANSGWSGLIDPFGRIFPGKLEISKEAVFQFELFLD